MDRGVEPRRGTSGVVKSVGRALALMEAFQDWRRPAGAKEVSRALDIPRSSANALLASFVSLGYLWFDPKNATYFPTLKVGLLGDWLIGSVRRDRALNAILQEVSDVTGETVCIAMRAGFEMQFVTIYPSTFPVALNLTEGAVAPLFESAVGVAWVSTQSPEDIQALAEAYNRQPNVNPITLSKIKNKVSDVAKKGAAVAYDKVLPGTGAIAVPYPRAAQGQAIIIGAGGPEGRIRRSEKLIIDLIQRLVRQTLG